MMRPNGLTRAAVTIVFTSVIVTLFALATGKDGRDSALVQRTKRQSITFIMGSDGDLENRFYSKAAQYYRQSETDRTQYVVTSCRSLLEIREYLENHLSRDNTPWGVINVVSHGNEWSGLGIPVTPGGTRTTTESIRAAIEAGEFLPLDNDVVDARTEIRIEGCALGRDQELLAILSRAFGGDDVDLQRPIVRSCRYFLFYETAHLEGQTAECRRYMSDFWYAFYRTGYRPGDIRLAGQLRRRYPDIDVDWRDALTRKKPRWLGDSFHCTFRLPVEWTLVYSNADSRPDLSNRAAQQMWIREQASLQEYLRAADIPVDCVEWRFRNIDYHFDDGRRGAGIKALGSCTILCVLKALTAPGPDNLAERRPLSPPVTDDVYYGAEVPAVDMTGERWIRLGTM